MTAAFTACGSPAPRVSKALAQGLGDSRRVFVHALPNRIYVEGVLACLLLALPCSLEATAMPGPHALHEKVQFDLAGPRPVAAGSGVLGEQPGTDWLNSLVEFLSLVPPECRAVANKQPHQKCEERKKGTLQQFKHDHPVLFNLAVACATFVLGFYLTGGFGGGK